VVGTAVSAAAAAAAAAAGLRAVKRARTAASLRAEAEAGKDMSSPGGTSDAEEEDLDFKPPTRPRTARVVKAATAPDRELGDMQGAWDVGAKEEAVALPVLAAVMAATTAPSAAVGV
jgi:hypothetical protein